MMKKKKSIQVSLLSARNSPKLTKLLLPKINFDTFKLKTLQKKITHRRSFQQRVNRYDQITSFAKNQYSQLEIVNPYRYKHSAQVVTKCSCQFHKYGDKKNNNCLCANNQNKFKNEIKIEQNRCRYLSFPKIQNCYKKDKQVFLQKQISNNNINDIKNEKGKKIQLKQKCHSVFSKVSEYKRDKQFGKLKKDNDCSKQEIYRILNKQIILPLVKINLSQPISKNKQKQKNNQQSAIKTDYTSQNLVFQNKKTQQKFEQKKAFQNIQENTFQNKIILEKDNILQAQRNIYQSETFMVNDFNDDKNEKFIKFIIVINAPNPDQNKNDYFYLIQQAFLEQINQAQLSKKKDQLTIINNPNGIQKNQRCSISVCSSSNKSSIKNRFSINSQHSDLQFCSNNFLQHHNEIKKIQSSKNLQRRAGKKGQIFPKFRSQFNLVQKKPRAQSSIKNNNISKEINLKKKKRIGKTQKKISVEQKYKDVKYQFFLSKQEFLTFIHEFQQKKEPKQKAQTIFEHLKLKEHLLDQLKISQILKEFEIIIQESQQIKAQFTKLISDKKVQKMIESLNQSIDESMREIQLQDQVNSFNILKNQQQDALRQSRQNAQGTKKYKSKYFQCEIITLQQDYLISKYFDSLTAKQNSIETPKQQKQLILVQKQLPQFQTCSINRQLIKPCIHHEQIQIQNFIQIKENSHNNSIFCTQNKNYKAYLKKKQYIQNSSIRLFDRQKQNFIQKIKEKRFFNIKNQKEDKKITLKELRHKRIDKKRNQTIFQRNTFA